jgi:hypothetical protein
VPLLVELLLFAPRTNQRKTTYQKLKRSIPVVAFTLLFGLLAIVNCQAKLGDNYSTGCREFGARGVPSKDWVYWAPLPNSSSPHTDTWCQFKDNRCVAVTYKTNNNTAFADSEIWRTVLFHSQGGFWNEYPSNTTGARFFSTSDNQIYARLSEKGSSLQIAYKTWIDRHHLWSSDDSNNNGGNTDDNLPPVQENAI